MLIDVRKHEVNCKIVYYGIGMGGKTTNLEVLDRRLPKENKSQLVSLNTEGDRTIFFDFLVTTVEFIKGWRLKIQLYTVPGQSQYESTRKIVLRDVDGVVLVADSQKGLLEENLAARVELAKFLETNGKNLEELPYILQLNKRDLPNIETVGNLTEALRLKNEPVMEAAAIHEVGVMETNEAIVSLMVEKAKREANP